MSTTVLSYLVHTGNQPLPSFSGAQLVSMFPLLCNSGGGGGGGGGGDIVN